MGWPTGEMCVAHKSAAVSSMSFMPGSVGGGAETAVPASRSGASV